MDITILEDLGLVESEIKTYLALLELGSSSAGTILDKSKLHNSVMHRSLNSLIEKGLVNYVKQGKRNIYQATDPEQFYSFLEEKKRKFDTILPELKQKQQFSRTKEHATIYKGVRGIHEVYSIMINTKGKEYNSFGGGTQCETRMGAAWWMNVHRRRVENNLPSRQVFDETVQSTGVEVNKLPRSQVRFLSHEFASFQETVIVGDKVAITVFSDDPYSFLIEDARVADGYRKHFEVLWQQAKK